MSHSINWKNKFKVNHFLIKKRQIMSFSNYGQLKYAAQISFLRLMGSIVATFVRVFSTFPVSSLKFYARKPKKKIFRRNQSNN